MPTRDGHAYVKVEIATIVRNSVYRHVYLKESIFAYFQNVNISYLEYLKMSAGRCKFSAE